MTKAVSANGKSPTSFPITLIVGGLAALAVAFQTFRLVLAKRKIAVLAHKTVVLEEDKHKETLERLLASGKAQKKKIDERINARKEDIKKVEKSIREKEKAAKVLAARLGGAKSWADIKIKRRKR